VTPAMLARMEGADIVFFDGTLFRDDEMITTGTGAKTGRARRCVLFASSSTNSAKVTSPVQRLMISAAIASALNTRSGASRIHPLWASLWTSRTPRGSRGRASEGMGALGSLRRCSNPAGRRRRAEDASVLHKHDKAHPTSPIARRI
jgi:hypothetical protein